MCVLLLSLKDLLKHQLTDSNRIYTFVDTLEDLFILLVLIFSKQSHNIDPLWVKLEFVSSSLTTYEVKIFILGLTEQLTCHLIFQPNSQFSSYTELYWFKVMIFSRQFGGISTFRFSDKILSSKCKSYCCLIASHSHSVYWKKVSWYSLVDLIHNFVSQIGRIALLKSIISLLFETIIVVSPCNIYGS